MHSSQGGNKGFAGLKCDRQVVVVSMLCCHMEFTRLSSHEQGPLKVALHRPQGFAWPDHLGTSSHLAR